MSQKPVTREYVGGDSVTKVLLCVSYCAVILGSVKYHNECVQYLVQYVSRTEVICVISPTHPVV